jgi:hypothetical protein
MHPVEHLPRLYGLLILLKFRIGPAYRAALAKRRSVSNAVALIMSLAAIK